MSIWPNSSILLLRRRHEKAATPAEFARGLRGRAASLRAQPDPCRGLTLRPPSDTNRRIEPFRSPAFSLTTDIASQAIFGAAMGRDLRCDSFTKSKPRNRHASKLEQASTT